MRTTKLVVITLTAALAAASPALAGRGSSPGPIRSAIASWDIKSRFLPSRYLPMERGWRPMEAD